MQSEDRDKSDESEDHYQPMELPSRYNSGTGVDRLEISFNVKIYAHGQHCQLLMIKDKYPMF